jgi:hypothetical protein
MESEPCMTSQSLWDRLSVIQATQNLATKWLAAIKEYEKALELAKSGKDKDFTEENLETIRFYLKRAKEYLKKGDWLGS